MVFPINQKKTNYLFINGRNKGDEKILHGGQNHFTIPAQMTEFHPLMLAQTRTPQVQSRLLKK